MRQRGRRGQHERGERRERCAQHQHNDQTDQQRRQRRLEHIRNHRVKFELAVRELLNDIRAETFTGFRRIEQTGEAAEHIAAAGDDQAENSRDHETALDILFVADCIEFVRHLRQSPCAERGQDDNAEQVDRIRAEQRCELAVRHSGDRFQHIDRCAEAAVVIEDADHNCGDADEHNHALNEVIDRCCGVAAEDDIDRAQHGHCDHDILIGVRGGEVECHCEQARETVVDRCGVGDHEQEDDDRSRRFERGAAVALHEEIRHGLCIEMLGHQAGALAQHRPRERSADQRIADADPCGGDAVAPAELSGIADEHDRGKICGAECECGHPRADLVAAEDEVIDAFGLSGGDDADQDHDGSIDHHNDHCDDLRS